MLAAVVATVSSTFPAFLTGAQAVQISAEFGVGEATYGWGLGGYFLGASCGSVVLGRLAQRIGPRRQIVLAATSIALAQLFIGLRAQTFGQLVAAVVLCGVANAGNQTAVNLALTQARITRLGLAMAVKQSGMPAASLLGGLMVPVLALTVGWRWAYVLGAVMAVLAGTYIARVVSPITVESGLPATSKRQSTFPVLVAASVSGGMLAFGAGALNGWLVSSGVNAGLSEALAGLLLSVGAAAGITMRLVFGFRLDHLKRGPFRAAGMILPLGVVGVAALSLRSPTAHVLATLLAFVGGWTWPVFTNFGIVRANPGAAASATGITQMGVYLGVFSAPLVTGMLIEQYGYRLMWSVVAAIMAVGTALTLALGNRF